MRAGDSVRLAAEAADADGSIAAVDFFAGQSLIGSVSAPPFQFD